MAHLAAHRDGATVRIEVRDQGQGVPEELLDDPFGRFTRAEAMADKVNGSGLGLHIARELARADGGDLRHEPTAEGPGATFVLTLPSARGCDRSRTGTARLSPDRRSGVGVIAQHR